MSISLKDYLDLVLVWLRSRTSVHLGELRVYPAMVRHCLCCQASAAYAHRTNGLCEPCSVEQVCLLCHADFEPSLESVGVLCPACWAGLETTWTTTFREQDPVRAESLVRAAVGAARPSLAGGCRHRR